MPAEPDIAVVGAGVTGISAAYHLAERGAGRIVVYDRDGIGAGASGVQPGGVRQQWSTPINCLMARESLAFYRRLDPGFRACGYLFLARAREALDRLRANVALQNGLGVPSRIVSPEEGAELVPDLSTDSIVGGSWCAEDGYFDRPQGVLEALAAAARRNGVELEREAVASVEPGPRLRLADGESVTAGAVVVAAGVDTRDLVRPLGVDLPIEAEERWLFYSDPVRERLLEPLVVAEEWHFAAKQLADGRVLASDLTGARRSHVRSVFAELLPRLEFVTLPLVVGGTYDVTPDRQAIVDRVADSVVVAAGFSGHGFMIAPEVGRIVAALVLGEEATPDELRADRFADGRFARESLVI